MVPTSARESALVEHNHILAKGSQTQLSARESVLIKYDYIHPKAGGQRQQHHQQENLHLSSTVTYPVKAATTLKRESALVNHNHIQAEER